MREKPMEKRENGVRVEHLTGALPMSEMLEKYVDVEKFLGYCAACPRCGQTWSCPPYDFDPAAVWPQYAAVTLYAVQVFPESEEAKAAAFADPEMFLRPYRRAFDALLEERERGNVRFPSPGRRALPRVRAMRAPGQGALPVSGKAPLFARIARRECRRARRGQAGRAAPMGDKGRTAGILCTGRCGAGEGRIRNA